jgi:hypothetical protein
VVYTYTTVKDIVIENLPSKNSSIRNQSISTQNQIIIAVLLAVERTHIGHWRYNAHYPMAYSTVAHKVR